MAQPKLGPEERAAFAETLYREKIRPNLTEADIGKFVIIDINSGEYEIDSEDAHYGQLSGCTTGMSECLRLHACGSATPPPTFSAGTMRSPGCD